MFRLVETGWDRELRGSLEADDSEVLLMSPFIKRAAVSRLMSDRWPPSVRVVTRFNLDDFCSGVSDTSALRLLLENGAQVRGIKHLHSKLYVFGDRRAVATSANLTTAALVRDREFGFVADDPEVVLPCRAYFERLWSCGGDDLSLERLAGWETRISDRLASGGGAANLPSLGDEGEDAGFGEATVVEPGWAGDAVQGFVKFFGTSTERQSRASRIRDEVQSSGCHWACTYPSGRRPRRVRDGAVMFMGRIVGEPADIMIYGRAIGLQHVDGRDDATVEDLERRPWKAQWPHYVRVHDAEFVDANLGDGISLSELMDELETNSFRSTQENSRLGAGNTNPRTAYRQQAAVELSAEALKWLSERFEQKLQEYGAIPPAFLRTLDWPREPRVRSAR